MPQPVFHWDRIGRHARRALDEGGALDTRTPGKVLWHIAGKCERPVVRDLVGRNSGSLFRDRARVVSEGRVLIELEARCRQCAPCLKARAYHWRMRAFAEVAAAKRTWFGTLTLRPEEQFKALSIARQKAASRDVDFEGMTSAEQFRGRHEAINPELTKYFKRIRKESNAPLKYLLVAEAHKSGAPHYHYLIHEVSEATVTHSCLSKQWKLGFSQVALVKDKSAAAYVCKYLSKSALARVRASKDYGSVCFDEIKTN